MKVCVSFSSSSGFVGGLLARMSSIGSIRPTLRK